MNRIYAIAIAILFSFGTGCATSFTGSAHIEKKDCAVKCKNWGMALIGMVAMGEYSDACICKATGGGTALLDADDGMLLSAGATAASSSGVIMQMRRAAEQANKH